MMRYDGSIWLEMLDGKGARTVAGHIYGDVVDHPQIDPELYIRGQPDDDLAGFFAEQKGTNGYPLKARISALYPHYWWITEIELKEISSDHPARVLLTSIDKPRRAVLPVGLSKH